ncbi:hypothetical protein, partial [Aeromonas caviae]|uniref:hypothetical protein n=1 Tax=Aeromonas caviae TaxID=648 RepID=UPI003F7429E6
QKRVIDQNGRSPSSTENSKIRCGMTGYQQLSIIMEKLSDYQKVIAICNEAKNEGWSGDWDKRIERCTKKQIKLLDKICK